MATYHLTDTALLRIDDIFDYTFEKWGEAQADKYVGGLFECFQSIASRNIAWRSIPAIFEIDGFYAAYEKHFVYWMEFANGDAGIVTILHQRMNIGDRLAEDFG